MEKTYNPQEIEQKWYTFWDKSGYFTPQDQENPYCIMIPPPNVTGSLHMGHGFQLSLMDALIRYHRMCGDNTLWQCGTDHAGISTQMVVERQLAQKGESRHELGREAFVERVWAWKDTSDNMISKQLRRMGASVDWTRERFTLDDDLNQAVIEVFVSLYNDGLIYRGNKLVNWDPHFRTAISDLEVISSEETGNLWYIKYPIKEETGFIVIATTRPETMLGDVAVAVHPDDPRYKHLIGKHIKLPLTDREIPIIADDYVTQEFGTGCVKITPAHDFNDYELGLRHQLPQINIFTPDAHINDNAPAQYRGLERFAARKQIVADLEALGLIEKVEPHTLKIPRNDRGNTIIEPYLTNQWFVKTADLAKPAIQAVEEGHIKFVPENWSKTYYQWMHNIQDWCISRQLWWGHRIPAWYDAQGNIYVGRDETEVREKHKLDATLQLTQDEDVLDTWFSSALWPFATLGWPNKTPELETFYPTNVLVTGFDIIFFWVARMIMMGLRFTGEIPFREVYITGLVRDAEGQKMSKTKGNVLDPIDLIDGIDLEALVQKRIQGLMNPKLEQKVEKATRKEFPKGIQAYGTDALRFTYCSLATTGRDIRFDLGRLDGYRNFCNKIWNAARYVMMCFERIPWDVEANRAHPIKHHDLSLLDQWILSRLQTTIATAHEHLLNYRFDLVAQTLYEFTWHEFCDWYLEFTKPLLVTFKHDDKQQIGTYQTLIHVLESILRLLHPFMPFITEEIWQQIKPLSGEMGPSLMMESYPTANSAFILPEIDKEVEWLKTTIISIRTIRSEMNINPGQALPILLDKGTTVDYRRIDKYRPFLLALAKLTSITRLDHTGHLPVTATAIVGELELLIPLEGLIDNAAELARLRKEHDKIMQEFTKVEKRLADPNYVDKAPAAVVAKEKLRLDELTLLLRKLIEKIELLGKI